MVPLRTFQIFAANLLFIVALGGLLISLEAATVRSSLEAAAVRPDLPFADVAGNYYRGNGLSINQSLEITGYGSFSYVWSGCLGIYDRAHGRLMRNHPVILLETIGHGGWDISGRGFLPVRWGGRHYLIPAWDVMSFVNDVNLGREPRAEAYGLHYMREDDWEIPVSGLPEMPAIYRQYLLEEPIKGTILRVLKDSTFEVAAGSRTPLLAPGMVLVADGSAGNREYSCQLKVVSVSDLSAKVERVTWGTGCDALRDGDPVSSRLSGLPSRAVSFT